MSDLIKFRYVNEVVGAMVILSVLALVAAVLQTGRLRNWFEPKAKLKVILPEEGLFGLSKGAKVKILGTPSGVVEQIVISPGQRIHAVVDIQEKMTEFVRRDSEAIIRKEFGVAGAVFLEITRGAGESLDWEYAVIEASAERAPTESMGELLSQLQTKVMPAIDDASRVLVNLNTITGSIVEGKGAVGRLLMEDRMAAELETLLTATKENIEKLSPILENLQTTVKNVTNLSTDISEQVREIPGIARDAGEILKSLRPVMRDLSRTTPQIPPIMENINAAASDMPVLLLQTQQTLSELTILLRQLQSHWLLGGGKASETIETERISPVEVTP